MKVKCAVCGRVFERSMSMPDLLIEGRGSGRSTIALSEFMRAHCCSDLCLKQLWDAIEEMYNEWQMPPQQSTEEEASNEGDI